MNILYIAPYLPSLNASHAGGIVMGKELEALSTKNNVVLLSFLNDKREERYARTLEIPSYFVKSNKLTMGVRCLLHPSLPFLFSSRTSIVFFLSMIFLIKKYKIDAVHADYTAMGQYVRIKRFFPHLTFTLVEQDVVAQSYMRKTKSTNPFLTMCYKSQLAKVKKKEAKYCNRADNVIVLSSKDRKLIEDLYLLDSDIYKINPYYGVDICEKKDHYDSDKTICFIGQMSRPENDQAAKDLINIFNNSTLSLVSKLKIIGANPSCELLQSRSDNIEITGFVDDLLQEIRSSSIGVFPLKTGAGIKIKVLQAAAMGLPIITTSVGAEGIDPDGKVLFISEDLDEQAKKAQEYLSDENKFACASKQVCEFVKENFSWEESIRVLDSLYS